MSDPFFHPVSGFEWAGRCPAWLDENQSIAEAPETCPNRARFAELRNGRTEE